MCGRFTLTSSGEALARKFELQGRARLRPRFNIAPSQEVAAVREQEPGRRLLEPHRWGLIPSWAKDPAIGNRLINARCETAAQKPSFRRAMRSRRCIVPADGFYEWAGRGSERHPYLIRMRDAEPFGMAGLWESWTGDGGEVIESCTLLTTDANESIQRVHHRMPVILDPQNFGRWLDPGQQEPESLVDLLVACPDDWLDLIPVSRHVNNPRNDDPACLVPQ
jgi:putative SOS response-associated peptidase YedK